MFRFSRLLKDSHDVPHHERVVFLVISVTEERDDTVVLRSVDS